MAVEMCKLSLWLVSLDPNLPFSFVDDKILHGNSLLGITDRRPARSLHIDPSRAWEKMSFFHLGVDKTIDEAISLRRDLATEVDDGDPQRSANAKRRKWQRYQELIETLSEVADGIIAAGLRLGGKPGKKLDDAYDILRVAVEDAYAIDRPHNRVMLEAILDAGLTPTVVTDDARWKPLHWALLVPDVLERGGFDAVLGNPPFLGGPKVTGVIGTNARDWLISIIAFDQRGTADIAAYFFLRAMAILRPNGNLGLIGTNSIAQGRTREVSLDQMVNGGLTIFRAIQSRKWPVSTANLEYSAVWATLRELNPVVARFVNDIAVSEVSTLLEEAGRTSSRPLRLPENSGIAFEGCKPYAPGFVVSMDEAQAWIDGDAVNTSVLFPYLSGDDLYSSPACRASRWVVDFNDRTEPESARFPGPFQHVRTTVKPWRSTKAKSIREAPWWKFLRRRPAMRAAIHEFETVLALTIHSRAIIPVRVSTDQVFSHGLVVFASDSFELQAVLSSSPHQVWAIRYGSGIRTDPRYTHSDVFETFPRPRPTSTAAALVGRSVGRGPLSWAVAG